MYGLPMSPSAAVFLILACLIGVAAVVTLAVVVVRVHRHAIANPDPTRSIRDPETGISEDEWMNGMR